MPQQANPEQPQSRPNRLSRPAVVLAGINRPQRIESPRAAASRVAEVGQHRHDLAPHAELPQAAPNRESFARPAATDFALKWFTATTLLRDPPR